MQNVVFVFLLFCHLTSTRKTPNETFVSNFNNFSALIFFDTASPYCLPFASKSRDQSINETNYKIFGTRKPTEYSPGIDNFTKLCGEWFAAKIC